MNNQGFSNDNLHIGDTYVKGDLDVSGDLTVGGSITGFNISNEVVCINRWYSTNQTGVFLPGNPPTTILKNNTSTLSNSGEKTVGSNVIQAEDLEDPNSFAIMNLKILNRVENNAGGDNINQFSLFLTTSPSGVTSDISWEEMNFGGFTLPTPGAYQNIEKTITFTRSAFNPNNIIVTVNCFKPTNDRSQNVPTSTNTDKFFTSSNFLKIGSQNGNIICPVSNSTTNNSTFILTGYQPGDDIVVDVRVTKTNNAPNVIEANLEYGTLNIYKQQELPSGGGGGGGGTGDHLQLTNLNAIGSSGFNDGGHDLMFLSNASKPINNNYFLPTTDGGVAGGVLTTDGAGTTSFVLPTTGQARVWQNKYAIDTAPTFGTSLVPVNIDATGFGSKSYSSAEFPIGAQIRVEASGTWNIDTTGSPPAGAAGQFVVSFGPGNPIGTFITDSISIVKNNGSYNEVNTGVGWWSCNFILTRTSSTLCRIGRCANNSIFQAGGVTDEVPIVCFDPNAPNNTPFNLPNFPFVLDIQFIDQSGPSNQCFPIAAVYNQDLMRPDTSVLVSTTTPTQDHNLLNNLTLGDAGHTQFALLAGRSGGQILSGGLTPLHNLVLKSHDIGLPNMTVRDLNTEFNKNIDLSNNSLLNGFGLNTQFLLASSQIETSQIVSVGLGQQNYLANPHRFTADGTPATEQLEINNAEISAFKPINMNDNEILQCNNIRTNTQPIFTINKNGSNATEIYGNSTIRRVQISNGVYLLTGTDLFCGNNDIRQCSNLEVSTINGLTPSGGLFMGTSDGVLITATTAETTLLPATFVGSLSVPANGFQISSYHLVLAGNFSSNNGDNLTIRLKSNGTILGSVVIPLNNSSGSAFEVEVDFQIRAVGGAGVADILSNFDFTYNQSGGGGAFVGERSISQNNTTFDTTISNTLEVSAQFSSTSANNSIQTRVSKLTQTY